MTKLCFTTLIIIGFGVVSADTLQLPEYKNRGCGYRNPHGILLGSRGTTTLAREGDFPWMAFVYKKEVINGTFVNVYKCGASLINKQVILTAAHCLKNYKKYEIGVRVGEWDTESRNETLPHQNRKVAEILKHPYFNPYYLGFDFALLILEKPINLAANADVVCLPETLELIENRTCIVSGWGKDKTGSIGTVLKSVSLPIVSSNECQERLKKTDLSEYFILHPSFLCAGGIPGYDTCEGDGGGPLVCQLTEDPKRWVQVGVVSWGISCNDAFPAAYAKLAVARPWIDQVLHQYGLDTSSYLPRDLVRKSVFEKIKLYYKRIP